MSRFAIGRLLSLEVEVVRVRALATDQPSIARPLQTSVVAYPSRPAEAPAAELAFGFAHASLVTACGQTEAPALRYGVDL